MEEDFSDPLRLSSFGGPTMDAKAATAASNIASMSNVDVISASVVARWLVVIKTELIMHVKERHEQGRNYVVNYA